MNKKLIFVASIVLALALIVLGVLMAKQPDKALPTTVAKAKALTSSNLPACRADNTKQLNLPSGAQQSIELAVIGQLTDVPAGTNVDVRLAMYTPLKITGSDTYGADYGSYNFTATKSSEKADWRMVEFVACK